MISQKNYVAGWFDSSIGDFLKVCPRTFDSMRYALITCLDSNTEPVSLLGTSPVFRSMEREVHALGDGLLMPTKLLLADDRYNQVFFGFDEVWFFPKEISHPKPAGASLVGPNRVDQERLGKFDTWMSENACSLALGDGYGLNLVAKAQGLMKYVLGHSIEQAPPNVTFLTSPVGGASERERT